MQTPRSFLHPLLAPFPRPVQQLRGRTVGPLLCVMLSALLAACGGGSSSNDSTNSSGNNATTTLSSTAALGEKIFKDVSLSASGQQACISCHAPDTGHASPNNLSAQLGGAKLDLQGGRNSPGMRYLVSNTAFFFAADGTPTGGFFWDGRVNSLHEQATKPFLNPKEMANESVEALIARLSKASYADEMRSLYGADIFSRPQDALQRVGLALQAYQQEDADFHPYDSKYDQFLRGQVSLNDQELRGLALFNAKDKGNCAACHPSAKGADGSFPLFTDFTYDSLGVPRNAKLAQNQDASFYDLGLCARDGDDLLSRQDLCGKFKVPTLRNVAVRKVFFHNGRFDSLREVLQFYVQRDTNPEKWYSRNADGTVNKFDDLPLALRSNVNVTEGPYNRVPGQAPALSEAEIDDVIAFLGTLTDGYKK
ncbi:cytochrome-c peroxidase [Roseateles koreensis]|uniref:Cytochrome c peroxidase n=1 Tax=Roseateles koreensis TaxID=2987526 RepID=A0ABT5KR49_9BURK|nr:cytochrome c peroxidase [Roseateles koreensis]MDC8785400.1 cytochrome c peroxidase [Roseateles koreensis]